MCHGTVYSGLWKRNIMKVFVWVVMETKKWLMDFFIMVWFVKSHVVYVVAGEIFNVGGGGWWSSEGREWNRCGGYQRMSKILAKTLLEIYIDWCKNTFLRRSKHTLVTVFCKEKYSDAPKNSGIKSNRNKQLPKIFLIRFNPQRLLLDFNIILTAFWCSI